MLVYWQISVDWYSIPVNNCNLENISSNLGVQYCNDISETTRKSCCHYQLDLNQINPYQRRMHQNKRPRREDTCIQNNASALGQPFQQWRQSNTVKKCIPRAWLAEVLPWIQQTWADEKWGIWPQQMMAALNLPSHRPHASSSPLS